MNLYAVKMAAVFMISTSTLAIRTAFAPRWIGFLGFGCALVLLFSGRYIDWILMVFPLWVLLISIYFPIDNLRRPAQTATGRCQKKFADIALRSDIRLRVDRLSFFELLSASANLCKA